MIGHVALRLRALLPRRRVTIVCGACGYEYPPVDANLTFAEWKSIRLAHNVAWHHDEDDIPLLIEECKP